MKIELDDIVLMRYITGECTKKETAEIERLFENSSEAKERFLKFREIWEASNREEIHQDPEVAWNNFLTLLNYEKESVVKSSSSIKQYFSIGILRYAAILLLLLIPILYVFINSSEEMIKIHVKNGNYERVVLSDGTIATLDSGSELLYPEKFREKREVFLNGEAFFEVKKNPEKPFVVFANQGKIQVLGTKFNIRSWKEINNVNVAVSEGKVSFLNNSNDADTVFLVKGEYSKIDGDQVPTKPMKISSEKISDWMKREKYFVDVPLSEVIGQLERWYNIDIDVKNKSALNQILSIHVKNTGYKNNLNLVSLITGLKTEFVNSRIILK